MTVEIRQKDYVDRATQTELPPLPSLNDDDHDAESPFNDELLSDDPLPVRQLHQKPHLGFNAPSSIARMMTSRVVSLPETSPPTRLKPSARVVSLTETTLDFMDDSLSSQENSISTIVSQISSDNSVHHLRRSTMPHTPSPPSSPESVMIIGNDVQVPISFSRHDHKMNKPSLVEDGDGWVSWAHSPPRPIPALHGPLSLPYARCPSGAEGTVMEGADISRAVWGLGNDNQTRHAELNERKRMIPERHAMPQPLPSHLASPYNTRGEPIRHPSQSIHPLLVARNQPPSRERPQIIRRNTDTDSNDVFDFSGGLGLTFGKPTVNGLPANRQRSRTFDNLPTDHGSSNNISRIFLDSREHPGKTSQVIIASGPRLSALDIAQQYRLKQERQNALLTPPDSTNPQWSRQSFQLEDDLISLPDDYSYINVPRHPAPSAQRQHQQPFDNRSALPSAHPALDESHELRKFVYEQISSPDFARARDLSPQDLYQAHLQSLSPNRSPRRDHRLAVSQISLLSPNLSPAIPQRYVPPSPTSPETHAAPARQPRSVPFARLMQRRLSSVVETEEESASKDRSLAPSPIFNLGDQYTARALKVGGRLTNQTPTTARRLGESSQKQPRLQHTQTRGPAEISALHNKENATQKSWGRKRMD